MKEEDLSVSEYLKKMVKDKDYREKEIYTVANGITLTRVLFTAYLVNSILSKNSVSLSDKVIATAVSTTDKLDGAVARKRNEVTTLGKALDPAADKVFNWGIASALYGIGIIPLSPLLIPFGVILARDAINWRLTLKEKRENKRNLTPTIPAKLKMVLHSAGSLSALWFGYGTIGASLVSPIIMGVAMLTIPFEIKEMREKYFSKKENGKYVTIETRLEKKIEKLKGIKKFFSKKKKSDNLVTISSNDEKFDCFVTRDSNNVSEEQINDYSKETEIPISRPKVLIKDGKFSGMYRKK